MKLHAASISISIMVNIICGVVQVDNLYCVHSIMLLL